MRKAQKQEVLEMIQTLHQAHDEIKNYIDKKNYALAQDILSQCQECAISIGTAIEKIEGEGFVTVSYVETYCDVVFSVYEELNGAEANANKAHKNLKKQLLRIENSVKNDVPVRKEIAFFPYKASMWDALESVYLEAKKDPNCDAYCVPIPYYDRNPDRSLGEMHYEGREYPKNIEVIDWQTYNFEERKPDVVYIHNPYDDWNLVTCVHPRYFSANLKKYTEELVYIPYFVLDEIEPNDQARIDGMKHFCFLPGVVNADKVIVQSEKMKQIYVNEYLKAAKTHGLGGYHLDRKKLEEKFWGLGSPKFDKVLNTKKEDLEIPEEWLKIIEKPDGSWKKIIFYNTSIAALLEHNEKMLEKMKWVFDIFKENKDEVALLWRPHPLIKSTVSSMRPQLWMEYEKLVNQYRQEGWGIYDDSSDMDRAVVLSDAYYGDPSSVVQVYQQTGKPVMIQEINIENGLLEEQNKKRSILIEDAIFFENKVWCYALRWNCLYAINIMTKEVEVCEKIPNGLNDKERLFASMKRINEKIYLIPFYAKKIIVFNMEDKTFRDIEVDERAFGPKVDGPFFMGVEEYQKYLYIFPVYSEVIIRLNTENNAIEYIDKWVDQIMNDIIDRTDGYFRQQVLLKDDKMFVPFCNANAVIELDCITMQTKIHKLGRKEIGYSGICFDGQDFWLSSRKSVEIVRWNLETGEIDIIENASQQMKKYLYSYVGILYNEDKVYTFPSMGEDIKINVDEENVIVAEGQYSFAKEDRNILLYYQINTGILTIIDKQNNSKFDMKISVDKEYIDDFSLIEKKKSCIIESGEISIKQLMEVLINH